MATEKVAISIDSELLEKLDGLVKKKVFPSRSNAIRAAVEEKLARMEHGRLARECARLDVSEEKALAEEGMDADKWPEY